MSRAGEVARKIGRWVWYLCGVGLLVLLVARIGQRWLTMWREPSVAPPRPLEPADIVWEPSPTETGQAEADRAEALRQKVEGLR